MKRISAIIHGLFTHPVSYRVGLMVLGAFRFRRDIAIRADGFRLYCHSLDRLIAATLWKYSFLGSFESRRSCDPISGKA